MSPHYTRLMRTSPAGVTLMRCKESQCTAFAKLPFNLSAYVTKSNKIIS